ncbi:MAG TPA: ABC transporter permease [Xanthobacteraceae bacterium]|jgi:NitT/TauT family transport system permease protein
MNVPNWSFLSKPPMTLVFLCLVALWEAGVDIFSPSPLVLPAPSAIVTTFISHPNLFLVNAWITLLNTLAGFALSVVIGVTLAIGIVYSKFLEATLFTALVTMNSVPKVAMAPLFVIWLGTGDRSKIGMAFMIAIFAIVIDAVLGLRSVDPDMLDLGRSLKGSPLKLLFKIRFPSALPSIFAGMKVAISLALVGTIVGEFVAAQYGLGYVILAAQGVFDTNRVFVALLILAIMGTVLFYCIELAERKAVPWHVSRRAEHGQLP